MALPVGHRLGLGRFYASPLVLLRMSARPRRVLQFDNLTISLRLNSGCNANVYSVEFKEEVR